MFIFRMPMKLLFVLSITYSLFGSLSAQIIDSVQTFTPDDSINSAITVNIDSMRTDSIRQAQQKAIRDKYVQSWKHFQIKGYPDQTEKKEIYYQFDDLINLNYTGFADIFRHQLEFQIFDFLRPGFPRFVARNNLLPHQTDIYLNGFVLNDPMHGMYNTHMISLDGLQEVDNRTGLTMYGYNNGINLRPRAINSIEEPYSRIMFRQGDYPYTDLDIDFSRKLSDNISINAGGINKLYLYDRAFRWWWTRWKCLHCK